MVPKTIAPEIRSRGERAIFEKIARDLGDEWTVLHSLGLTMHTRKAWSEIDFVLVGPPGVICLEVKGGRVACTNGVWTFTDRFGGVAEKREGPFAQVAGAAAALTRFFRGKDIGRDGVMVAYAVCMPDVRFECSGPDVDQDLVFDVRNIGSSFAEFVAQVSSLWRRRFDFPFASLSAQRQSEIVKLLRRDFDARPELLAAVDGVLLSQDLLTDQQVATFQAMVENQRVLIKGGAGTGKTLIAIHEANRLAAEGLRVGVICFGRHFAEHLRGVVDCTVCVETLHGLMFDIIRSQGAMAEVPDASRNDLMRLFYPELCVKLLSGGGLARYDAVIVDEGQDLLNGAYLRVIDGLLKGGLRNGVWRFFYDPWQNVFRSVGADGIQILSEGAPARMRLDVNCRNSAPIAITAAILAESTRTLTKDGDGPEVEFVYWATMEDQYHKLEALITHLEAGGVTARDLVVLGPRRRERSVIASGAFEPGIADGCGANGRRPIAYSTIAEFKGLEAKYVIIVDLESIESEAAAELMYVGCTRPRAYLALFLNERCRDEYRDKCCRFGERLARERDCNHGM
jgi:hypothetical protein